MPQTTAVAGISDHAGWAVVVCVANGEVIDRRRIELLGPELPNMPYHHDAQGLAEDEAAALIARVRQSAAICAAHALAALPASVQAIAIRKRPPLPATVAERIASYHAQTRADGVMYRDVLAEAAHALGWSVAEYEAKAVLQQAGQALGTGNISAHLAATAAALGPPWRKDHRVAMAAAIVAASGI
jgi:hypothetical protein